MSVTNAQNARNRVGTSAADQSRWLIMQAIEQYSDNFRWEVAAFMNGNLPSHEIEPVEERAAELMHHWLSNGLLSLKSKKQGRIWPVCFKCKYHLRLIEGEDRLEIAENTNGQD